MHDQPLVATVIGPDVHIRGEVILGAAARIDGRIEGRVESSGELLIGPGGVCACDIDGAYVIVEGVVQGDVTARERLELRPTGQICGEINAASISIAEGATFVGQCRIGPTAAAPVTPPAPTQHPPATIQPQQQASTLRPVTPVAQPMQPAAPSITTRPLRMPAPAMNVPAVVAPAISAEDRRQNELLRDPEMAQILRS